jgi:hypothetical protein
VDISCVLVCPQTYPVGKNWSGCFCAFHALRDLGHGRALFCGPDRSYPVHVDDSRTKSNDQHEGCANALACCWVRGWHDATLVCTAALCESFLLGISSCALDCMCVHTVSWLVLRARFGTRSNKSGDGRGRSSNRLKNRTKVSVELGRAFGGGALRTLAATRLPSRQK